jgi:hypothetical protein
MLCLLFQLILDSSEACECAASSKQKIKIWRNKAFNFLQAMEFFQRLFPDEYDFYPTSQEITDTPLKVRT